MWDDDWQTHLCQSGRIFAQYSANPSTNSLTQKYCGNECILRVGEWQINNKRGKCRIAMDSMHLPHTRRTNWTKIESDTKLYAKLAALFFETEQRQSPVVPSAQGISGSPRVSLYSTYPTDPHCPLIELRIQVMCHAQTFGTWIRRRFPRFFGDMFLALIPNRVKVIRVFVLDLTCTGAQWQKLPSKLREDPRRRDRHLVQASCGQPSSWQIHSSILHSVTFCPTPSQ